MARKTPVFFLAGIVAILTSCTVQESFNPVQIEVLQPGKFPVQCAQRSIAVVNRDYSADSIWLMNSFIKSESTPAKTGFAVFPQACSASLVNELRKFGQFRIVKNFSSALSPEDQNKTKKDIDFLFQTTRADLCICLDSFHVFRKEVGAENYRYKNPYAYVQWTLISKYGSAIEVFKRDSTFAMQQELIVEKGGKRVFEKSVLTSACDKIARLIATEVSPQWITVERLYYHSKNEAMMKGEELARENKWVEAAEFWRPKTEIRKKKLAAKACFNMAVVCEIEGKTELAIEWLTKAKSVGLRYDQEHQDVCKQYLSVLQLREKDAAQLEVQMKE